MIEEEPAGAAAGQLAGLQNEEQEAQEARLGREFVGEQLAGGRRGRWLADDRYPEAAVKASVIACSGRCQKLIRALWPPMVHSSVQL